MFRRPRGRVRARAHGPAVLRTETGRIYQRPFGGQSKDFGKGGQAARTCAAADRTGHALLHTLYQANLKNGTSFLNEWYAVDLVKNQDGAVVGIIAICIETGETVYIRSKAVVLATGGAGRIYASTTNALINTGDGVGMACVPACRCRTSRCGSSTRPASPAPVYWSPKVAAAKAVT